MEHKAFNFNGKPAYTFNSRHQSLEQKNDEDEGRLYTEDRQILHAYKDILCNQIAAKYQINIRALNAPNRCDAETSKGRQLAMYLFHTLTGSNLTITGEIFGRDRTTVAYGCARIEDDRDDMDFDADLEEFELILIQKFIEIKTEILAPVSNEQCEKISYPLNMHSLQTSRLN